MKKPNIFRLCSLVALLTCLSTLLSGQNPNKSNVSTPFSYFIGKWTGEGAVEGVAGKYERSYQYIFNRKFIEVKNKSVYPPSNGKPKGEVHEDLGFISYDNGRKTFVLRQFHIEGFVNQYRLDTISPDNKYIIFRTENIENIPSGWSAREIYQILNEKEFTETFELAEPGKPFETYSKVRLTRQ
jgi:hypothetical protein